MIISVVSPYRGAIVVVLKLDMLYLEYHAFFAYLIGE